MLQCDISNANNTLNSINISNNNGKNIENIAKINSVVSVVPTSQLQIEKIEPNSITSVKEKQTAKNESTSKVVSNTGDLNLKMGGLINMQYGFINQETDFKVEKLTNTKNNDKDIENAQNALTTYAELNFTINKEESKELDYGGYLNLKLFPSVKNEKINIADKMYIYLKNKYGKFEIGNNDGAEKTLSITAGKIAVATDGIDGDAMDWIAHTGYVIYPNNPALTTQPNVFSGVKRLAIGKPNTAYREDYESKPNKITYFTPQINGVTFGVSYIPNVQVVGGSTNAIKRFFNLGYQNVFEGGVLYSSMLGKIDLQTSLTGQIGKAKDFFEVDHNAPNANTIKRKINNLRAWTLGSKMQYQQISVAGSYGNWGKSGTLQDIDLISGMKKGASVYTLGAAYSHKIFETSLTYMYTQRAGGIVFDPNADIKNGYTLGKYIGYNPSQIIATSSPSSGNLGSSTSSSLLTSSSSPQLASTGGQYNTFQMLSLGLNYKLRPGIMPYAEFSAFKYKSPIPNIKMNSGNIFLIGAKLRF